MAVEDASPAVLGYYTLSTSSIVVDVVPRPQQLRNHVPVALIGRFAITRSHQGRGLGKLLLVDALLRAERAGQQVAAHAVVVNAIDDEAVAFYRYFGFERLLDDPQRIFLPMEAVVQLRRSSDPPPERALGLEG